ncbi:MAG: hypothetical protein SO468_04600 [Prevotella sp.]|nr:hypothetical protein [Prevotella sp.]
MSSIKTTQIDGDVSVGRNVAIGGKADIAGSVSIGHNLKVDGWLEAPNIKGANKGIFLTVQELREAYPVPHDGWMAGVGASTPFTAYVGKGGDWVATGGTIEVTVDMSQYTEGVAQLQEDIDEVAGRVQSAETNINSHTQQLTTIGNQLNNVQNTANEAESKAETNENSITALAKQMSTAAAALQSLSTDEQKKAYIVELSNYMEENSELPKAGSYVYNGNPVECRLCTLSDGYTTWLAFCISRGDDTDSKFGERITECILYSAESAGDPFYFVGHYYDAEDNIPQWVHELYGYSFAEKIDEINKHLTELGEADEALEADSKAHHAIRFGGIIDGDIIIEQIGLLNQDYNFGNVLWAKKKGQFVLRIGQKYYNTWRGTADYVDMKNLKPYSEKPYVFEKSIYMYDTVSGELQQVSGGAAVGNCYNVTAARVSNGDKLPTSPATYDTKQSAIEYAISKEAVGIGVQITFASSATTWKTYQYIGLTDDAEALANLENWIDVAGQSAGDESVVNINLLCKDISIATTYTLAEAIAALTALRTQKNVDYVKAGMVITYKVAEGEWETKQLIGGAADYTNTEAWADFGGSGNDIVASDVPEEDGTDAFSTGGAHKRLITNFIEDISDDGTSKTYQAVNAKGEGIGDPIEIPLNQGGGGSGTVTSFRIVFENNPLYAAVGGNIIGRMAARSYTQEGEEIVYNKITNITIIDAITGVVLSSRNLTNENSSSSLVDFKFELDFTEFFDGAGSREFTVRVTDQEGNVRSQNISVIAVDVTVEITKALNECRVNAGSGTLTLDNFYRFEKNALKKDGGIDATIEMYYNGEWRTLGEANITDTFTKSISLNPSDLFGGGETMQHGSYLLRIHGYAPNAKVEGNYVYTSIMCIDNSQSTVPVVAIRYDAKNYDDQQRGEVALYDNVVLQVAAYTGASVSGNTQVSVFAGSENISTFNAASSQVYNISYQVQGRTSGDVINFHSVGTYNNVTGESNTVSVVVSGSAIDVIIKDGAAFGFDFALRTNADADKTIEDNGVVMTLNGVNWSSNGFSRYLSENCLRIAENVTGEINYRPFNFANAETSGLAVQFAFATNNIKDDDAMLMKCYDPNTGTGWYVKGNVAGIFCNKGEHRVQERKFRQGEKITMAVVVEPSSIYHERGGTRYSCIKLYLNGEEVACIGYTPGQSAIAQTQPILFDGTEGDFYLYYIMAYQSHYEWAQAFNNYLAKLTDVTAMMEEFASEDVLNELGTPSLDKMKSKGIPYYVIVADQSVFDAFDGDTDTSVNFSCTLYYFNPDYPCLSFKATGVRWRRQGTTSAKRPIKNDRFYLNKASKVELLTPDDTTELGRYAIALAALKYTLVRPDAIPVQIITCKVDYSDSSGANDCGVCDMMNATFRALGSLYMTPAQRAFDGTFTKGDVVLTGRVMNHSTRNHPIAVFRATSDLMTDAWFHAKGNWKEDKGEQLALGFQDTPCYNKGCVNYGDFVEYFGTSGETLTQTCNRFLADASTDTSKLYLISQYCGRDYAFYRHNGTSWVKQTGSMKQVNGKWQVTGTVLNPVSGYELLSYQGFCWWMGVSSVADMMEMKSDTSSWVQKLVNKGSISTNTFPAWTQYFECMIDDDQLQIDLALGKKVPYELYRMLKFCNDASYASGIDASGRPIAKTGEDLTAWQTLWRNDLWKYASVHSLYAYTLFTDYLAATDQRAKNMQPMFFLEDGESVTDGVYSSEQAVRMYLNKVYDCDTCNGKDNDGGCTVDAENNPNKASSDTYTNPYAGWGSILFNNVDRCPTVYLDATHTSGAQLNLKTVCAAMRSQKTTVDGVELVPFSPEGAKYFFVEKRLKFWKKLISSYDGEHKYIEPVATSDAIYFYALQGLGLTSLPQFIEQRWRIRDGYYQTGNFFSGVLSGRIACASNAKIHIKAAKTGYFGVGHDASGNLDESVFLEAGEEHDFTQFSHTESALLYIYQADRMSEIDLSEISIDATFNFSVMSLVEKIAIGSATHSDVAIGSYTPLSTVQLGNLPFLRELDLRNTTASSVDASGCPRIESILATGSVLTSCTLAETSPISTLALPGTMTELQFINLPNLSYPGGMTIASMGNVTRLMVSGSPKIDAMNLINGILQSSNLQAIGLRDVNITASVSILRSLIATKAYGLDANGNDIASDKGSDGKGVKCSGLTGSWVLSELIEDSEYQTIASYFPVLELYNSQYTLVEMDDTLTDPQNITNKDNNTTGDSYEPSGHISKIRSLMIPVTGKLNPTSGRWEGVKMSESDYKKLKDGSDFDYSDNLGSGNDAMMRIPHLWYKGINDFKNQKKYIAWSSLSSEPISSASRINRKKLSQILMRENAAIMVSNITENVSTLESSEVISETANHNTYQIDVDGMKQVRYPGLNNEAIGACFLDESGVIISKYNMAVANNLFDFVNGDYIFINVPSGAKTFVFTSPSGISSDIEAIAVDSTDIEAIEPDWVESDECLGAIYQGSIDSLARLRSVSGVSVCVGTGTSTTSIEWQYDADGNPTNTPTGSMNYTAKDLQNLARRRGAGYQLIDYELSKLLAILFFSLSGTRDSSKYCGYGKSSGGTTGYLDSLGNTTSTNLGSTSGQGNKCMGFESFFACTYEWMDMVAVNVPSFVQAFKDKMLDGIVAYPIDAKYHIYDPIKKTEREVQALTTNSGYCVARTKHGRFCDIVASKFANDNSKFATHYADAQWYTSSRCRVVGRSHVNASANGGVVYADAGNASSFSGTNGGSRLAFRGEISISE